MYKIISKIHQIVFSWELTSNFVVIRLVRMSTSFGLLQRQFSLLPHEREFFLTVNGSERKKNVSHGMNGPCFSAFSFSPPSILLLFPSSLVGSASVVMGG